MEDKNFTPEELATMETFNPEVKESGELAPITSSSLQYFPEDKQQEILKIAGEIDVAKLERVMSYGQIPIMRSFELAGKILKEVEGSEADQEVIKQVLELAKQANSTYEDFNLVIHEPSMFQKLLLKILSSARDKRNKEIKIKAITNYKLLGQFKSSCDIWIDMLKDTYDKIMLSAISDKNDCYELEEYLVAGYIAKERIIQEVDKAKEEYEKTGLIDAKDRYDMLKEGLETFQVVLLNLEKSRVAYAISLGQLSLQQKANRNIQIAVRTQKGNSLTVASQQLRNAVLDARNREALEGQKLLTKLNDELMQKVASNAALTAEESEQILMNGIYTVEAALQAANTVIEGCHAIERAKADVFDNIGKEMEKLKGVVDELAPYVNNMKTNGQVDGKGSSKEIPGSKASGNLVF